MPAEYDLLEHVHRTLPSRVSHAAVRTVSRAPESGCPNSRGSSRATCAEKSAAIPPPPRLVVGAPAQPHLPAKCTDVRRREAVRRPPVVDDAAVTRTVGDESIHGQPIRPPVIDSCRP